jgi:hypothetical protein
MLAFFDLQGLRKRTKKNSHHHFDSENWHWFGLDKDVAKDDFFFFRTKKALKKSLRSVAKVPSHSLDFDLQHFSPWGLCIFSLCSGPPVILDQKNWEVVGCLSAQSLYGIGKWSAVRGRIYRPSPRNEKKIYMIGRSSLINIPTCQGLKIFSSVLK